MPIAARMAPSHIPRDVLACLPPTRGAPTVDGSRGVRIGCSGQVTNPKRRYRIRGFPRGRSEAGPSQANFRQKHGCRSEPYDSAFIRLGLRRGSMCGVCSHRAQAKSSAVIRGRAQPGSSRDVSSHGGACRSMLDVPDTDRQSWARFASSGRAQEAAVAPPPPHMVLTPHRAEPLGTEQVPLGTPCRLHRVSPEVVADLPTAS